MVASCVPRTEDRFASRHSIHWATPARTLRGRGREREKKHWYERELLTSCPLYVYWMRTKPMTQVCALTWNWTCDHLGAWRTLQPTEPHQPGNSLIFLLSFSSEYFHIALVISLIHWYLEICSLISKYFSLDLIIIDSNIIALWPKNILCMILSFLNLLKLVLQLRIWSVLINIAYAFEKSVYSVLLGMMFCKYQLRKGQPCLFWCFV